jgi:putative endopeptidase
MPPRRTQKKARQLKKPCVDFYSTVNDRWQQTTHLPETETRITQAFFIQKDINRELDTIINSVDSTSPMGTLIRSWKQAEGSVPDGLTPLFQIMMTMSSVSDIAGRIGWMNRYGIPAPLAIYIQGDPRDHSRCRVFIEEGEPRIGIPEYWTEPEYRSHRKAYAHYVHRLASALGLPQLLKGYGAEREFSSVFPTMLERREKINMLTWGELCKEYRTIDWTTMLTAVGLQESQLKNLFYNVTSPAFLHHIQQRLTKWSMDRWCSWFTLMVAQWIAGCSPHGPLRSAWFDYARRHLQGSITDESPQELRSSIVRVLMPNTLGRLWVHRYCNIGLRRNIKVMIQYIQNAATAQLAKTPWMTESTRKAALRKLRRMDVQICWPDLETWKPTEAICGLSPDSLVENLLSLGKLLSDENQELLTKKGGCRNPTGDSWGKPVYEVNAYYYPDENRFVLPAAILRPPFYDPAKSLAWNYGSIGATIGHEFCHAFDSDGRQYDENGDKRDWWTPHDDREYRKKARQVVRLYESEQYRGLDVDGELTLVENIADLGGIEFALGGLVLALGREATKAELREFFGSFAISWRSKDRLKRATELLAMDMHSPPMLRVNHVVRQQDAWYYAFDVDPTCEGWIAPEHRIHFFA